MKTGLLTFFLLGGAAAAPIAAQDSPKQVTLLNVSYDPTRELYEDYNKWFASYWKAKTGQEQYK